MEGGGQEGDEANALKVQTFEEYLKKDRAETKSQAKATAEKVTKAILKTQGLDKKGTEVDQSPLAPVKSAMSDPPPLLTILKKLD